MSHKLLFFRNLVQIKDLDKPTSRIKTDAKNRDTRGQIEGFSKRSKVRLHRLLERINHPRDPIFVTLTYQRISVDWKEAKRHLTKFFKRLRRVDPELSGIWRLEFQKRGSPHFHIVLWASDDATESVFLAPDFLSKFWVECSCQTSRAARKYSCDAELVRCSAASFRYMVGHHLKEDQIRDDLQSGRYWGIVGRDYLQGLEPSRSEQITDSTAKHFKRLLAKYLERKRVKKGTLRKLLRDGMSDFFVPFHEQGRLLAQAQINAGSDDPF